MVHVDEGEFEAVILQRGQTEVSTIFSPIIHMVFPITTFSILNLM